MYERELVTGDHFTHHHNLPGPREGVAGDPTIVRARLQTFRHSVVGAVGLVVGLVPHVLHHVGLLAGTALVAGSGGTALFGVLGFAATVPMLVRLYRKFHSWAAPAIGLLVFAAMFSLSAFVIGPAISGTGDQGPSPVPADHSTGHPGDH